MPDSDENIKLVTEFDLTPHPRVLAMLGEITFSQVNCLTEFIDNSIDGFLHAKRNNNPILIPHITIDLPSTLNPAAQITVTDNGPGMSCETLEKSAKVGWSGNNPFDNLGLFGMGFNIAMARLSSCTKVWTTRREDKVWHGTEVNIREMQSAGHFKTPILTRPKNKPEESGTEIIVSQLKPEQLEWFSKANNRARVKKDLAEIYSAMLREDGQPISFNLIIGPQETPIVRHCVWGHPSESEERVVRAPNGDVNAYQLINKDLGSRKYCEACWVWLLEGHELCHICEKEDDVSSRKRKISGWLGIQRFCDKNNYGIDFIRNGRKIEVKNKDLFYWEYPTGKEEEYPIDDLRLGGRIVGEIHIDHCKVPYTKNLFSRTDPHWDEMILALRGDGPLLPMKRRSLGFGENHTPLYKLVRAFHRAIPRTGGGPGSWANVLGVRDNNKASEYAKSFARNDPDYQSDEKWYQLIIEQEEELTGGDTGTGGGDTGTGGGDTGTGGGDTGTGGGDTGTGGGGDNPFDDPPDDGSETGEKEEPPNRVRVPSLSNNYRSEIVDQVGWQIEAFRVEESDPALENNKPWALVYEQQRFCFYFNPQHSIFKSKTMDPSDALLAVLAHKVVEESREEPSFDEVFCDLRRRYDLNRLDGLEISGEATELLDSISIGFSGQTDKRENDSLWKNLDEESQQRVIRACAENNLILDHVIENGDFLKFCERKTLLEFFEANAELYFDGRFWKILYSDLSTGNRNIADVDLQRKEILKEYRGLVQDVIWLERQGQHVIESCPRARVLRSILSIRLLKSNLT
jgi:hypothetical protein